MPSIISLTDVLLDNDDGTLTPVAGAIVKFYDATTNALLATVVTDANGVVLAQELNVPVGTSVRASVVMDGGVCGYAEEATV